MIYSGQKKTLLYRLGDLSVDSNYNVVMYVVTGKKGEITVAVKTLKENASEKEKIDLLQELLVMKNLGYHPNVVQLIGCCTEKVRS